MGRSGVWMTRAERGFIWGVILSVLCFNEYVTVHKICQLQRALSGYTAKVEQLQFRVYQLTATNTPQVAVPEASRPPFEALAGFSATAQLQNTSMAGSTNSSQASRNHE